MKYCSGPTPAGPRSPRPSERRSVAARVRRGGLEGRKNLPALALAVMFMTSCGAISFAGPPPRIRVEVRHAPGVDFDVGEVVFAPPGAPSDPSFLEQLLDLGSDQPDPETCRVEFEQALSQMFLESDVRVATYGSHEEADAMIEVSVTRCRARRTRDDSRSVINMYSAETRLDFRALVEVTDLSDNRVAFSRTFAFDPVSADTEREEYPDYPPVGPLLGRVYAAATADFRRQFLGVETRDLIFFDDEKCGLHSAYRAVQTGDYDYALELSLGNAESCRPDPAAEVTQADVAAAHYNVGVLYRIMCDFDSAMEHLERAREADPTNDDIAEAVDEVRSAAAAAAEVPCSGTNDGPVPEFHGENVTVTGFGNVTARLVPRRGSTASGAGRRHGSGVVMRCALGSSAKNGHDLFTNE